MDLLPEHENGGPGSAAKNCIDRLPATLDALLNVPTILIVNGLPEMVASRMPVVTSMFVVLATVPLTKPPQELGMSPTPTVMVVMRLSDIVNVIVLSMPVEPAHEPSYTGAMVSATGTCWGELATPGALMVIVSACIPMGSPAVFTLALT